MDKHQYEDDNYLDIIPYPDLVDVNTFIRTHKHWIHYCEAIIMPNGLICEANPSHTYAAMKLANLYMEDINVQDSPIECALTKINGCAVWYNNAMIGKNKKLTKFQRYVLRKLYDVNMIMFVV